MEFPASWFTRMIRYSVGATTQFDLLWQMAIDRGVIDSLVGETKLMVLARFLSVDPYGFPLVDTGPGSSHMRWVNFEPGIAERVEIWYSVVEDDRTVFLESVEIIDPPQPTRPGFDPG